MGHQTKRETGGKFEGLVERKFRVTRSHAECGCFCVEHVKSELRSQNLIHIKEMFEESYNHLLIDI